MRLNGTVFGGFLLLAMIDVGIKQFVLINRKLQCWFSVVLNLVNLQKRITLLAICVDGFDYS